jgi:hypothetical protein
LPPCDTSVIGARVGKLDVPPVECATRRRQGHDHVGIGRTPGRSSLVLRPAGDARDEVQRSCGEKVELRALQWA